MGTDNPLLILVALALLPTVAAAAAPPGRSAPMPLAIPLNPQAGVTQPATAQPTSIPRNANNPSVNTPSTNPPAFTVPSSSPSAASPATTATAPKPSGQVTIDSDLQQADQTTGIITATGNVRIVYPDQRVVATARQAQYFTKEDRVVLTGDVDVIQEGGNHLRAERVIYLVKADRVIAEPAAGQQVFSKMVIQPKSTPPAGSTPAPAPSAGAPSAVALPVVVPSASGSSVSPARTPAP
jgi:lipopolysaccharide export system protein LptA